MYYSTVYSNGRGKVTMKTQRRNASFATGGQCRFCVEKSGVSTDVTRADMVLQHCDCSLHILELRTFQGDGIRKTEFAKLTPRMTSASSKGRKACFHRSILLSAGVIAFSTVPLLLTSSLIKA